MAFGRRNRKDVPLQYNSLDELLEILAEERRKSLRKRRNIKIILSFYLAFAVLLLIAGIATEFRNFNHFGGMFSGATGMLASMYAATQKQRKGVKELAQFNDLRAVPRLIEMLEYNDNDLKLSASELLQTLLPRLQASDAPMLTPEHHAILNRALKSRNFISSRPQRSARPRIREDKKLQSFINRRKRAALWSVELQVAILNALRQVGDESSLPIVRELSTSKAKRSPLVQQAAEECLPFLQQRVEQLRETQTLLRASDGNNTPSDVLLRAASGVTATANPDELLRAAPTEPASLQLPLAAAVEMPVAQQEQPLRTS